ncbi:Transposase InsO and inactivated derivatives, partial [Facklamia miroungae]
LPANSYHYHKQRLNRVNPDQKLEEEIQQIFLESNETYGYRRITAELYKTHHQKINHKKVLRIMNNLGLRCTKFWRKSRRYSSYKGAVGTIAPNHLNRRFSAKYPLQKLVTDVTEFKTADGKKLYLSPIMDLFNSEIIAWNLSSHPTLDLVMKPVTDAIDIIKTAATYRTTLHSAQGWHYQHKQWVKILKENKIFQSMSRKGNCLDNSPMENFFGLLKQEMYYGEPLTSYKKLKNKINQYIHHYNHTRIKQKLSGMSPVEYRIYTTQFTA